MTLGGDVVRDFKKRVGRVAGDAIVAALNDAGADGSVNATSVTVASGTSDAKMYFDSGAPTVIVETASASASFNAFSTIAAMIMTGASTSLAFQGTSSNANSIAIPDNLAIALKVVVAGGGANLMTFVTTDNAEEVNICPASATTQKLGFFGKSAVVQQAHIADPAADASALATAFATLLDYLKAYGLLAADP